MPTNTTDDPLALSNYECSLCGFDDFYLPGDHWCPMCTEARGLDVLMRCNGFREEDAVNV